MSNTYIISDTHFGHANILTFKRNNGSLLRTFNSIEEHDETLVNNWNRVVKPQDRVYHLGDVVINRRCLPICSRLNGRKKLVRGNHDLFKLADYTPYFEDVLGCAVLADIILTHIPVHPGCITTRFGTNVHGHLHSNRVQHEVVIDTGIGEQTADVSDPKYFCVSAEQINYTPMSLEEVRLKIKEQQSLP